MSEFPPSPERRGPYDHIINHVYVLARAGKPDEDVHGMYFARFRPTEQKGIDWILLQVSDGVAGIRTAIIQYEDGTSYDIDWQSGDVWSFTHRDPAQGEGKELDRVLPFTNGLRRIDYKSNRFDTFDLNERVTPELIEPERKDAMIDKLAEQLLSEDDGAWDAWSKDIDPADVDIEAMCAPIMALTPTDRVYLFPPDYEN